MKTLILLGILLTVIMSASADTASNGIVFWVNEVGTNQWEAANMVFTPDAQAHPRANNGNMNSRVHIALDGEYVLEARPLNSANRTFTGHIWWDGQPGTFDTLVGYVATSSMAGPWGLPTSPALVKITSETKEDQVALLFTSNGRLGSYQGYSTFEVAFPPVPEPAGIGIVLTGFASLIALARRRR